MTTPLYDAQRGCAMPEDGTGASSEAIDPDVYLDVPVVLVDEITLDVQDLRAKVSLQAEVLDLLLLSVGADVFLGSVNLTIKGVEAQALLKVRLDNVARIIDRVLGTIDANPQILENLTRGLGTAVRDLGTGAGGALRDVGTGAAENVGPPRQDPDPESAGKPHRHRYHFKRRHNRK
ncbi:hypothetical protein ACU635_20395 [[Actinomadura] parvosata]|uniref:hypothetical protein n=1 Tax=[Actinomadura] parvosata TaxID=1955412 RepID=UPI00406D09FE